MNRANATFEGFPVSVGVVGELFTAIISHFPVLII